ncbi:MAG: hypothetical protein K2P84_06220, partial [Undibacterium sp.]|nr:hypothetical protein [Undibacterium sp.]
MKNVKSLKFWIFALYLLCFSAYAMQEGRFFPEGVKRGKLSITAMGDLVIDGKLRLSSMSLVVLERDNSLVQMGSFNAKDLVINY